MNYKPPIKAIIDKPEDFIPKGYDCFEYEINGKECPFLQWRKMTSGRLEKFKKTFTNSRTSETKVYYDIPAGNKYLQYCSYLKEYLSVQDCLKDCNINMGWCTDEEIDEIMNEVEEVKEKIKIKEKYELLAKYAEKYKGE